MTGLVSTFSAAEVFEPADVQVAQRITTLAGERDEHVQLAVAFAVRALRGGSVCVDLKAVESEVGDGELPWPSAADWLSSVQASRLLDSPAVLHLYGDRLLYLDRYWLEEEQVARDLLALAAPSPASIPADALDRLFPLPEFSEQRTAAKTALSQSFTVLTGGPGTGKTTTVARLLALIAATQDRPRIGLAAPTGKAAARLQEAVAVEVAKLSDEDTARLGELRAVTVHRLLGAKPDTRARFRHDRGNRLPHDVIVVDETSMVSLTMMARLLEAVRPETRLVLVGDPDQLASVQAGAVLADLVEGMSGRDDMTIAALETSHRFGAAIGRLAHAIRDGDADGALEVLRVGGEHIEFVDADDPTQRLREVLVRHALRVREAAVLGVGPIALTVLDEHRLLCAHRAGPYGVSHWNAQVERWLTEETGQPVWSPWYAGRPLLVTANDYGLGVYNGDTGVVVATPRAGLRAWIGKTGFATSRVGDVETMYAMTIHKSQGSQAREITVLMPPEQSRLLTRELFYTAVTRAKEKVRVVGSESSVRAAIERRAVRASGLAERLQAERS